MKTKEILEVSEKAINNFLQTVKINQPISSLKDIDPNEFPVVLEYEFPKADFGIMSPIIKEMEAIVRVQLPKEGEFDRMIRFQVRYGYRHTGGGSNGYTTDYLVLVNKYHDEAYVIDRNDYWNIKNISGEMEYFEEERDSKKGQEQVV